MTRARGCMAQTQTQLLSAFKLGECIRGAAQTNKHTHTHACVHTPHTAAWCVTWILLPTLLLILLGKGPFCVKPNGKMIRCWLAQNQSAQAHHKGCETRCAICAADVVETSEYLSWEWRLRLLFDICSPSLEGSHLDSLMCPHSSSEDHFTYYCSAGMLWAIKHIPYTSLVLLICSLFSFQACIKSGFDLGFLALNVPFLSHLFSSCCFFAGCTCLRRSKWLIKDQSLRSSGADRLWTTGAQRRKWPAAPWSAAWTRVRLQRTIGWKKTKKKINKQQTLCTMLWPQIKLQIEPRGRGGPPVHLPCFYLLLTLVSVSHTQTAFIINCSGAPAVGCRTSTTAILTPALDDNRE